MPPCAQRPADLDHFLRAGGARRRVGQPGGHADGAGLQRLFHPRAHDGDLGRRSLAFQVRHRGHAQRDVAQQHGAVGRRRLLAQGLQIIAVAFVAEPAAVAVQQVQRRHHARRARRQRDAAVAGDHGGDALADLGRHGAVGQHGAVVMGMGVDEARRQHQAARVDLGAPRAPARSPTRTMRPSSTATSPSKRGAPVPSTISAPRINRSWMADMRFP